MDRRTYWLSMTPREKREFIRDVYEGLSAEERRELQKVADRLGIRSMGAKGTLELCMMIRMGGFNGNNHS